MDADDPRVNFAISQRGRQVGVDHLGLQAEDANELSAIGERLLTADAVALAEKSTTCCYARLGQVLGRKIHRECVGRVSTRMAMPLPTPALTNRVMQRRVVAVN